MEEKQLKRTLHKFLMASYLYYHRYESVVPDTEYDQMARDLLGGWDNFEHQHKHLLSKESLAAGTLFNLREEDYPGMVVGGALLWLNDYCNGKGAGE